MQMSFACAVFNMVFCPVSAKEYKKEHCKAVLKQYKQAKKEGKVWKNGEMVEATGEPWETSKPGA